MNNKNYSKSYNKNQIDNLITQTPTVESPGDDRKDFIEIKTNYNNDINHVDTRLIQIQDYISSLQTQVNNLKNLINNETNPGQRGKFYQILNECLELIATFESLYLKAMEVKFRYRKEQSDFICRKARYIEIELAKLGLEDKSQEVNTARLVEMLNNLEKSSLKNETENEIKNNSLSNIMTRIEDDDKYRL